MTLTQLINCINNTTATGYGWEYPDGPRTAMDMALTDAADKAELQFIIQKYRENGQ